MKDRIRDYCVTPNYCAGHGCTADCITGFQHEVDRRRELAQACYEDAPLTLAELDALSMRLADPAAAKRPRCEVPPEGWECTREPLHDGPCAAVPTEPFHRTVQSLADYVASVDKSELEARRRLMEEMARNAANPFVVVAPGVAQAPLKPDTKGTNPKDAIGVRKAPLSTVPMNVIAEVGVAMLEGASKYGRHNYRGEGVRASVYFDAGLRHLIEWWEGIDTDADSGMSHITKAIAGLVVLRDSMLQGNWTDDRPPKSKPFYPSLNVHAAKLIAQHEDKKPHHYTEVEDGPAVRSKP